MAKAKTVGESRTIMTELVLPNDTNPLGNMMGGRLLHLMDIATAITAQRHANHVCVTASVDSVEFRSAIKLGEVVNMEAHINRAFNTSIEVEVNVWAENPQTGAKRRSNRAFYTFVAVDKNNKPVPVPKVNPLTEEEELRYKKAARRREFRLLMAGRLELADASNIKDDLISAIRKDS